MRQRAKQSGWMGIAGLTLAAGLIALPGLSGFSLPASAWAAQPATAETTLKVGDPAPALKVGTWVRGEGIDKLEPGTVYVVEFWATWCGPCKATIPHLTKLAKKHKNAGLKVIGVSIWEQDQSLVAPFVQNMGDKMDYLVATDDLSKGANGESRGTMATTWMDAAGLESIPTAFIVDRAGRVAFIGHPLELDAVLPAVLAGTYDPKAEQAKKVAVTQLQAKAQRAFTARDWDTVLPTLEELAKLTPDRAAQLGTMRFGILLEQKKDVDAAYALASRLADSDLKDDPNALNLIAWAIVDRPGLPKRDLDLALKLAQRAVEVSGEDDSSMLDTLARVHFERGELDKAIEVQTKALAKATSPADRQSAEAALSKYQAAKGK